MKGYKNSNFKICAIIQARTTSTRLPNKVLLEIIDGKSMLWHVINRLRYSKKIDEIILAIPDTKENDVLEDFAKENKVKYFRGSEEDVLSRYYKTAKAFNVNIIVRITSDCPLIDPKIVDLVIEKYLNSDADYTANSLKIPFLRGLDVEVFNFEILERAHKEAKEDYQREHVTSYIYEQPRIFKLQNVEIKNILKRAELRLTVDTKEDLKVIKKIYKYLYNSKKMFYIKDIIDLLDKYSELAKINTNVQQKKDRK